MRLIAFARTLYCLAMASHVIDCASRLISTTSASVSFD